MARLLSSSAPECPMVLAPPNVYNPDSTYLARHWQWSQRVVVAVAVAVVAAAVVVAAVVVVVGWWGGGVVVVVVVVTG